MNMGEARAEVCDTTSQHPQSPVTLCAPPLSHTMVVGRGGL